jgi:hypothetical protein
MASEAAFDPIFEHDLPLPGPARGPVFGDFLHTSSGRRLLVMVEPIATTSRARENAARILEVAGSRFRAQPLMALRDIVVDCCDNAIHAGDRPTWPKLRTVGVTAAIIDGKRAIVARTSPGAILLVQDGKLEADPPFSEMLDAPSESEPDRALFSINFQTGDVLLICSSALHRSLKRTAAAHVGGTEALAIGLCENVDDVIFGFEELAKADDLDATAGALLIAPAMAQAMIWQPIGSETNEALFVTPVSLKSGGTPGTPSKIVSIYAERTPRLVRVDYESAQIALNSAPAPTQPVESKYERLHTFLLHAYESHAAKRAATAFAFDGGSTNGVMPGASTVQLFRGTYGGTAMTGIRTHLPRGPRVHVPTKLISMVLTVLVLLASLAFFYQRSEGRAEAAKSALTAADVQLASAENESNTVTLTAELALAEQALATAEANGASDKQLEPRRQALADVKDRMANIVRLTNVTRVGMVPSDVAVLKPKLIQHGDDTYLVGGGLYHLDPGTRSLNLVLREDKKIAGGKVGELIGGTVDRQGITLTDGFAIYRTGTTGKWKWLEIGKIEDQRWDEAKICGTFGGSFYILNADSGQILKFEADQLTVMQNPWASQPELEHALDMVVDSKIFVLLDDGRLMSFNLGEPETPVSVSVTPAINAPTVMFGAQDINFMYVADKGTGNGRISRVNHEGELSRQYLLPDKGQEGYVPGAELAFSRIDDFVVNEANGQIVILSGDQIWSATIPTA